jgi:hypothetical protein
MSVTQDAFDFLGANGVHDVVRSEDWDMPIISTGFPAVRGERHLTDETKGRNILLPICVWGYETHNDLEAGLTVLWNKKGKLTGNLTIDDTTYPDCTFVGFQEQRRFYDGSDFNQGWVIVGLLMWRQRVLPEPPPPEAP